MGRVREIAETCRGSSSGKKAKVAGEEQVDRLSNLPDSVLIHILSLLPTRDAAKTLMIPTLGRLWDQTFNLDFDWSAQNLPEDVDFNEEFRRFITFMDRALTLHRSPRVSKFRLNLDFLTGDRAVWMNFSDSEEEEELYNNGKLLAGLLDHWLESAVGRNVETLHLNFIDCGFGGPFYDYTFPDSVLRSTSLVELRLVSCGPISYTGCCMKALRNLCLVDITLPDDMIEEILSACPVLETLALEDCHGFRRVRCRSSMLKTVVVSPDRLSEREVDVSGQYITSLNISGWIERVNPGDLPSLHDATIDIFDGFCCVPDRYLSIRRVFKKLSHANVLTMHELPLLVTMIWELLRLPCPLSKWQCLILRTKLNKWHLPGIANLLRNSPSLERLDIHVLPGELHHTRVQNKWLDWYKFDDEDYWTAKDHSFSCLRNGLKTVTLSGDVMKNTGVQLVQFLLSKAMVLEELVIFIGARDRSTKTEEFERYKKMVFSSRVVSHTALIIFR